jgi:hypothetical protein
VLKQNVIIDLCNVKWAYGSHRSIRISDKAFHKPCIESVIVEYECTNGGWTARKVVISQDEDSLSESAVMNNVCRGSYNLYCSDQDESTLPQYSKRLGCLHVLWGHLGEPGTDSKKISYFFSGIADPSLVAGKACVIIWPGISFVEAQQYLNSLDINRRNLTSHVHGRRQVFILTEMRKAKDDEKVADQGDSDDLATESEYLRQLAAGIAAAEEAQDESKHRASEKEHV